MLCEQCGENEATVHVEAIAPDGSSVSRELCQECASRLRPAFGEMKALDISDFMTALLGRLRMGRGEKENDRFSAVCPKCGTEYREYKKNKLLGCAECYRAFREPIEEMLVRKYSSALYIGSAPGGRELHEDIRRAQTLRDELQKAIRQEEYETAARLRDELKALNEKIGERRDA